MEELGVREGEGGGLGEGEGRRGVGGGTPAGT